LEGADQRTARQIKKSEDPEEKNLLQRRLDYMRSLEMAVIVSEEGEEEKKFAMQKLTIKSHRDRMNKLDEHGHDVEFNCKDPGDPLQLVFVCAMWLTGFRRSHCLNVVLDKPMKDHTLMQTIARANRVTTWKINGIEKRNGEIVDYYNVFRNMRKALKDYARGQEGQECVPRSRKGELCKLLDEAIDQGTAFCMELGINVSALFAEPGCVQEDRRFPGICRQIANQDEWRKGFAVYENTITGLYEACKPEILGKPVVRSVAVFQYLRGVVDAIIEQKDLDTVGIRVGELLDESLVVDGGGRLKEGKPEFRITQSGKTGT